MKRALTPRELVVEEQKDEGHSAEEHIENLGVAGLRSAGGKHISSFNQPLTEDTFQIDSGP